MRLCLLEYALLEISANFVFYGRPSFEHFVGNVTGAIARKTLLKINDKALSMY